MASGQTGVVPPGINTFQRAGMHVAMLAKA